MIRALLVSSLVFLVASCGGSEGKARDLIEHAHFEEAQGNIPNATKMYRRVAEKYPETAAAEEARRRLAELADSG